MSIATEISRLQTAKTNIGNAITAKGGSVSGSIDTYAAAIAALPSGAVPDPNTLREVDIQNYSGFTVRIVYSNANHAEDTQLSDYDTAYLEADINTALLIQATYNGDHFSPTVSGSVAQGVYTEAIDADDKDTFIIPVYYPGDDEGTAIIITL